MGPRKEEPAAEDLNIISGDGRRRRSADEAIADPLAVCSDGVSRGTTLDRVSSERKRPAAEDLTSRLGETAFSCSSGAFSTLLG
jgi:hypothetical protein